MCLPRLPLTGLFGRMAVQEAGHQNLVCSQSLRQSAQQTLELFRLLARAREKINAAGLMGFDVVNAKTNGVQAGVKAMLFELNL